MKKIFVVMGLVISSSLYLNAITPDEVTAYFTSGYFEREWRIKEYTPQQVEAFVDRLVVAVNQPTYVERVMPLIMIDEVKAGKREGIESKQFWSTILPLEYLASEDVSLLYDFFYSLKKLIPLKNEEHRLIAQLTYNTEQDQGTLAELIKVRNENEAVGGKIIIGSLAYVAGYHALGVFTPEALAFLDASYDQFKLKWFPLMLAMPELPHRGVIDKDELTNQEVACITLIGCMGMMMKFVELSEPSRDSLYQEHMESLDKQLDVILAIIDDYRNQHQAA